MIFSVFQTVTTQCCIMTCHAQSLGFNGQRHGTSEGSGNEICFSSCYKVFQERINMVQVLNYFRSCLVLFSRSRNVVSTK